MSDFLYNKPSFKTWRRKLRKNQTEAEDRLWKYLRNKRLGNLKFYRQYSVGHYILDFFCPKARLAVELDGSQHLAQKQYDEVRTMDLQGHGIKLMRFWDNDVLQDTEIVVSLIGEQIKELNNSP